MRPIAARSVHGFHWLRDAISERGLVLAFGGIINRGPLFRELLNLVLGFVFAFPASRLQGLRFRTFSYRKTLNPKPQT